MKSPENAPKAKRHWGMTDLSPDATRDISSALTTLLADVFALYLKTKNFHLHLSGSHFRDYHLLLDEQGEQIFAMTDSIAERPRKIGGTTLRSIGHIAGTRRIADNDAEYVEPQDMLAELRDDNQRLTSAMREVHDICDKYNDTATASVLENWIDETEGRTWFLYERPGGRELRIPRVFGPEFAREYARRDGFAVARGRSCDAADQLP
jgi:starvation-inducible DNA-binding protein